MAGGAGSTPLACRCCADCRPTLCPNRNSARVGRRAVWADSGKIYPPRFSHPAILIAPHHRQTWRYVQSGTAHRHPIPRLPPPHYATI